MEGVRKRKKLPVMLAAAVLGMLFLASIGMNIYLTFWGYDSYLQSPEEIYIMESGILYHALEFAEGEDYALSYDFDNEEYPKLIEQYGIDKTAGDGTEFERALRLMNEYAKRLRHNSNYDNSIEMNAISLLAYSLDHKNHGINCRSKAQILNEMCLALGIYSRKVWIMPNSRYDHDCHVVNEVWDSKLNKWVMLDITNNEYWVDENGTPLSVLEIREKGALQEFCTPVQAEDKKTDLDKLKEKYIGDFLYIMKNMVYLGYCDVYTTGEGTATYLLFPENLDTNYELLISKEVCEQPPMGAQ